MNLDFKGLSSILTTVAPAIATSIGGPLAGGAVAALEGALNLPSTGTTSDRQNALVAALSGATPDQLLALKQADNEYSAKMAELGFKDRESAREREIATSDSTPRLMAYAITAGFFVLLGLLMFVDIPEKSRDALNMLLGALGGGWASVIAYFYGSSAGSKEKTQLLGSKE